MCGLYIPAVTFNFFLMIGAHFYYCHLCIGMYTKKCKGYADMVVEISFCCVTDIMRRQHCTYKFFGSGFTIASCNCNKRNIELFAVIPGKVLQCLQYVLHLY